MSKSQARIFISSILPWVGLKAFWLGFEGFWFTSKMAWGKFQIFLSWGLQHCVQGVFFCVCENSWHSLYNVVSDSFVTKAREVTVTFTNLLWKS